MEDYVSFSLAKKLKEKNFIGNVEIGLQYGFYYKDGKYIDVFYDSCDNADVAANEYLRPTISQVLKWLRDEKKIAINVEFIPHVWQYKIVDMSFEERFESCGKTFYEEYEAAALAGIEYVLDNLI